MGENAVEREEGEKIGGFLFCFFPFFQYCVALTLLLLGRSLLSLLAGPGVAVCQSGGGRQTNLPPPAKNGA